MRHPTRLVGRTTTCSIASQRQPPGYGYLGVCVDSAAAVQQALTGSCSLFPLVLTGDAKMGLMAAYDDAASAPPGVEQQPPHATGPSNGGAKEDGAARAGSQGPRRPGAQSRVEEDGRAAVAGGGGSAQGMRLRSGSRRRRRQGVPDGEVEAAGRREAGPGTDGGGEHRGGDGGPKAAWVQPEAAAAAAPAEPVGGWEYAAESAALRRAVAALPTDATQEPRAAADAARRALASLPERSVFAGVAVCRDALIAARRAAVQLCGDE